MADTRTGPAQMRGRVVAVATVVAGLLGTADAADVEVAPRKLIIVDKLLAAGKAKTVFVAKDPAVVKGAGTDPDGISVRLHIAYSSTAGSVEGAFVVPAGSANGWVVNNDRVAKYVNTAAPSGPTQARVVVIKPGKLLKLVAKGLGDSPLAIPGPSTTLRTAYCVDNEGAENCHCSELLCTFKFIAGGTGGKLVCKNGSGDQFCFAKGTTTTTLPPRCCEGTFTLAGPANTCTSAIAGCALLGLMPAAPGLVCDGSTGTCQSPPETQGACCEFASPPDSCGAGPDAATIEAACAIVGGTYFANRRCTAGGDCVP